MTQASQAKTKASLPPNLKSAFGVHPLPFGDSASRRPWALTETREGSPATGPLCGPLEKLASQQKQVGGHRKQRAAAGGEMGVRSHVMIPWRVKRQPLSH